MEIISRTPFSRDQLRNCKWDFPILRIVSEANWLLRLASPSAWIFSFFKRKYKDNRWHTRASATETLVLVWLFTSVTILWKSDTLKPGGKLLYIAIAILLLDIIRANVDLMVIRPANDSDYKPFNSARTLLLAGIAFCTTIFLFAATYNLIPPENFSQALNLYSAFALSMGVASTSGLSGISPKSDLAFFLESVQAATSIVFVAIVISAALSRQRNLEHLNRDEPGP